MMHFMLSAQAPAVLDSKMKPGTSNDMRIEELKVRWKKAALENCAGVPCVTIAVPGAPTAVVATAGNASASVAFVAPANNGGSAITGYTVTSNPATSPVSGATSPINVTGLTNGTSYTFTVVATNAVGNSLASAASTAVTPVAPNTVPGAPTAVVATAGNASSSISFLAPTNNGGSAITVYTVTSNPGNITATGATSPINVTGLMNGTAYTFTVVATNAVGSSVASSASTAVTPAVCPTSTVTDVDGNIYNTVAIGTQCWTKENLKVTKYNNSDVIPDSTNASNSNWGTVATGARTDYVGVSGYVGTYGYLYNWYAATDTRKICPSGWHVPTDGEWRILIQSIDPTYIATNTSSTTAGGRMKTTGTDGWLTLNTGTNASGFSAKGGGFRRSFGGPGQDGNFGNVNRNGFFWSTTTNNLNTGEATFYYLLYVIDDVQILFNTKGYGLSIRCVKD